MTVELGAWMIPLAVTVAAFTLSFLLSRFDVPEYGRTLNRVVNVALMALAAVASLAAWFAWAMVLR